MSEPRVLILGGGPAGVGAAFQLRRLGRAQVTLIEQQDAVGGNAGSFEFGPHRVDYGSHRLHPACDPAILNDIQELLGGDLLDRPRHGRIHLRGKWVHFPLKPLDLLLRLDRGFAAGAMRDMLTGRPRRDGPGPDSFASVLNATLGPTICQDFYFPYARKIWGREPDELSSIQARRRVSASSFAKLVRKILAQLPGARRPMTGRFYYPRRGYGQISDVYAAAARKRGAEFLLGWRVTALEASAAASGSWKVMAERNGQQRILQANTVWSTLPISLLARIVRPEPPTHVLEAASKISYRSMLLVYLDVAIDRFTEFDAHYFPNASVRITRLSEPKNYAARAEPLGRTALCAELPCAPEDEVWTMSDEALGRVVAEDLARVGLPLPETPAAVYVRRLKHAYPIYLTGYEGPFGVLDEWVEGLPGILSYGRQGLFAHDNTHHALYMAYCAADCLEGGAFDTRRWSRYREVFNTHVVED